jgi:D-arabinose 1-dehydrogenase-like Zn-dependent alcohol dehydrogenase
MDLKPHMQGYAIHDNKRYTDFKVIDFQPKTAGDYDIDIAIKYCGVCASDHHTITGGWGETILPLITGHEVCTIRVFR